MYMYMMLSPEQANENIPSKDDFPPLREEVPTRRVKFRDLSDSDNRSQEDEDMEESEIPLASFKEKLL